MSKSAKSAYLSVLSAVGLIVLLVGLFTEALPFMTGLIIAIACWVASSILAKYWKVKKG
jgi:hypothetical protein